MKTLLCSFYAPLTQFPKKPLMRIIFFVPQFIAFLFKRRTFFKASGRMQSAHNIKLFATFYLRLDI